MKIKSMRLESYRCFSDFHVDFDERLTVLVGANGSGKTAVLDGAAFFLRIYSYALTHYLKQGVSGLSLLHPLPYELKIGARSMNLSYEISDAEHTFDFSFQKNRLSNALDGGPGGTYRSIEKSIKKHSESSEQEQPLPVIVYYTSKRVLNSYGKQNSLSVMTDTPYTSNAFDPQIDFSTSLQWFIGKASQEALEAQRLKDLNYAIPELSAVRGAVARALGDYDEPYVGETPHKLFITPKGRPDQPLQIEQLSDGYRTMLALVMDLARRMAMANEKFNWPEGQGVLHSPAVVLVDEVELHLHPAWQQKVLPSLMEIFPGAQFVVSTHSPQILTSIAARHIRILKDEKVHSLNEQTKGAEAGRLLEDVFKVNQRPFFDEDVKKLMRYSAMVYSENWDSPEVERLRRELEKFGSSGVSVLEDESLKNC